MASFTKTIPRDKPADFISEVLSRKNDYFPLAYRPTRAEPGDYLYLIYRGSIAGRVKIASLEPSSSPQPPGETPYPAWAAWIIRFNGSWEKSPRDISLKGHQSVRYLDSHGLVHLDRETW